ncbi:MAG: carboxypeptidase M32 [Alphaproteobacteria bacterium]
MTGAANAYAALERRFARAEAIDGALSILHWDQSVIMPPAGVAARADQIAALTELRHAILTDPAMPDLLAGAEAAAGRLDPWQAANLREMKRSAAAASAVPDDLVGAHARACTASESQWRVARRNADYAMLLPALRTVLDLTREVGSALADALGLSVYDALLDRYEPGGRSASIDPIFDDYAAALPGLLDAVLARQAARPAPARPEGPFPVPVQEALSRRLAEAVGLDFDGARLDRSAHPFSTGAGGDIRITTRYDEADFSGAVMAVLHESGHAMYSKGLPTAWTAQPVGQARGMALHESQSLAVEMQAARSRAFYEWLAPVLRTAFGGTGTAWDTDNLHALAIRVEPGFIRVDADEVTYPAHVILRYRLERRLIDRTLDLADLPQAWNDGMRALLGIVPPDDARGCLQDIHWPDGAFGYFPTYTLGAMTAAQLFQAATAAEPDILPGLGRGDFRPLIEWMRANVHAYGSFHTTEEILVGATGRPLDPSAFLTHIRARYLA